MYLLYIFLAQFLYTVTEDNAELETTIMATKKLPMLCDKMRFLLAELKSKNQIGCLKFIANSTGSSIERSFS